MNFIFTPLLLLYRRWAQANQPEAGEVMARDTRKPVLYLRPFKIDEYEFIIHEGFKGEVRRLRAEALFLGPFEVLGPLVAIGRPAEDMPPWGARRGSMWGTTGRAVFESCWIKRSSRCSLLARLETSSGSSGRSSITSRLYLPFCCCPRGNTGNRGHRFEAASKQSQVLSFLKA
jgi:hypothetical protein